jgi:60 kDa SS-A/Ro ribonucleoprotein
VIDNGQMLRSFVQIMRSGQVGRKSLGTRPKRLVKEWLEQASMARLMQAATGTSPSLADVVRMVHPAPADAARRAFYGWLIGKPYDVSALPAEIAAFEAWKQAPDGELPPVPFEWLTAFPLSPEQWGVLATREGLGRMGWQALRMNLNTLARNGAFAVEGVTETVAARLADADAITRVRPMPYQLMVALGQVSDGVPLAVQAALESALEASLARVPKLEGQVVVCPDVSGSMGSPATGYRKGASSKVRCIDIAVLVAAAVLRQNRDARVIPFEQCVVKLKLDPRARVAVNAAKLAGVGGGGTNASAPLALLNAERARVDVVVIVSDNESWVDPSRRGATATMAEWSKLKARNPGAKLICIDIQPYGTTQAKDRKDIMNVGGFTDAVFDAMARFAKGETRDWVEIVKSTEV